MKKTTCIQAIKIKDNDSIIKVDFINNSEEDILITKMGNAIKIPTDDIKPIGRLTSGVKGIGLKDEDEVISALIVHPEEKEIAIITSKGKGKRIELSNFIIQNRGGRGGNCIKLDSGDYIAAAALISEDSSLLINGKPNSICIKASELVSQTKNGMGTKVIERSTVSSIVRL
jgi:DNA gyrase/topoisomerase IV subunit A